MTNRLCQLAIASLVAAAPSPSLAAGTTSCVPGFSHALFGENEVKMTGGSLTDSYNSATSTFTLTNGDSDVGTNGSSCGDISISGGVVINGDVDYGASGTSCTIQNSSSTITGTTSPQSTNTTLPSVTIPTLGTDMGDIACGGSCPQPFTLPSNKTYGDVSVSSGKTLKLTAGTYVMGGIKLVGGSNLEVASGPVLIYISCSGGYELDLSGGSVTNSSLISTNLVFMVGPGCGSVKVSGGSLASYAVYAPDSNVNITGGSDLYGAVVGDSITVTGGTAIHYDRGLSNFATGPFSCKAGEVSRASPVVATVGGTPYVVQGTYEYPYPTKVPLTVDNVDTWTFSWIRGHMRAKAASSITQTASSYASGTNLFDAATKIPSVTTSGCSSKSGTCRRIFTTTNTTPASGLTVRPALVEINDSLAPTIGPLITAPLGGAWTAAQHLSIVRAVMRAPLGGVDRSTVAVIEPSTHAPAGTTRPTMAYFGGTDGMLHAVCVSSGGTTSTQANICPQPGTELWAFMPRVQLPLVGTLNTRIDGSVHVVDMFGDFTTGSTSGLRSFRTILTFQTGFSSPVAKPATYAFDVTDPASPVLLWESTTPTAPGVLDVGAGLRTTPGRGVVGASGAPINFVVLETNNGGTGSAGVVATALQIETGERLWQFGSLYPAIGGVPPSGIPGGAVGVDRAGKGYVTDVVMADLYGRLWLLDLKSGTNVYGTDPVFQFSTMRHPIGAAPAIYSNGNHLYAAFVSGGYVDPTGTSWNTNSQYAIAVKLAPSMTPVDETATACQTTCDLQVKQSIAGSYGSAQATIVGTTLQLVTDSSNVSAATFGSSQLSTGKLFTVDLVTGSTTTAVIYSGAGSLASSSSPGGTTLYSGGNDKQQQVAASLSTLGGTRLDNVDPKVDRKLWLRTL